MDRRHIWRIVLSYFFRGLLLTVPVAVLAMVLWKALTWLDQIIPYDIPGLGILTLLASVTLIGWLGSTVLYQPFAEFGNEVLQRIPFLKTIYDALKDLVEALVGSKKKFDRPVLVKLAIGSSVEKLGFITQDDLGILGIGGGKVAVYLPHSFAWSGNLYIVPVEQVTPIDAKAGDVMKFIVSGGVAHVDDEPLT